MHALAGHYRVGRDAELRQIPSGESVINLSLATNYGRKGQDGKKPTQWVDAGLWGKMAESLCQYLTQGQQVFVVMEDVHIEDYAARDGTTKSKLVGRIQSLELIGQSRQSDSGDAPAPRQAPAPRPAAAAPQRTAQAPSSGFDDMDDDIPF